eukprot:1161549-Pelagomonas_calceolata.AAC.8
MVHLHSSATMCVVSTIVHWAYNSVRNEALALQRNDVCCVRNEALALQRNDACCAQFIMHWH